MQTTVVQATGSVLEPATPVVGLDIGIWFAFRFWLQRRRKVASLFEPATLTQIPATGGSAGGSESAGCAVEAIELAEA